MATGMIATDGIGRKNSISISSRLCTMPKIAENDSQRNADRGGEQISFQESTERNHQVLDDRTGQHQLPERHHHLADRRHIELQLGRRARAELPEAAAKERRRTNPAS